MGQLLVDDSERVELLQVQANLVGEIWRLAGEPLAYWCTNQRQVEAWNLPATTASPGRRRNQTVRVAQPGVAAALWLPRNQRNGKWRYWQVDLRPSISSAGWPGLND
jgi:hypothetical protein